jgi:hypothetical protein
MTLAQTLSGERQVERELNALGWYRVRGFATSIWEHEPRLHFYLTGSAVIALHQLKQKESESATSENRI